MVSSTAAALIMLPFGARAAILTCQDVRMFIYLIILAAASGYATPFGYPTNLAVMTPGNYRKRDYLKFGLPLEFISCILTIALCYIYYCKQVPDCKH